MKIQKLLFPHDLQNITLSKLKKVNDKYILVVAIYATPSLLNNSNNGYFKAVENYDCFLFEDISDIENELFGFHQLKFCILTDKEYKEYVNVYNKQVE